MQWKRWHEHDEWNAKAYRWPRPETLDFLSTDDGYQLAQRFLRSHWGLMSELVVDGLTSATKDPDRWRIVVQIARHGFAPNVSLLSKDIGISEQRAQSVLNTIGIREIIGLSEVAGRLADRADLCSMACQNARDPIKCFKECMKEGTI